MDLEKIKKSILGELYYFDSIDSTNSAALKCEDAADGSLFLAANQTSGRGRMGRSWQAFDGGIYMTVLLRPEKITEDIPALTLMAGLCVSRMIDGSFIKWPNDIILGSKKVAGILAETKILGNSGAVAVGIGVNANNTAFSEDLADKATSIYLYSGKKQDKTELVTGIYCELMKSYKDFDNGFSGFFCEYKKKCITLNREIEVIKDGKKCIMKAVGIGEKGELIAEKDGKRESIAFGEVSVRGLLGYA